MLTAVLPQCCSVCSRVHSSAQLFKTYKITNNSEHDMAIKFILIVFALLYMHVCAYVCDQLPPTLDLLIKVLSIVTHSNANSGMLTHTYHTPLAQVVPHFQTLVASFDLVQ